MTTTPLTPPEPQDAAAAEQETSPARSTGPLAGAGTVITIVAAIVGGFALAGAAGGAAFAATGQFVDDAVRSGVALDVDDVTELELDSSGAEVIVRFDDVDRAELVVDGHSRGKWDMRVDGDTLVVHSPESAFDWWGDWGWFGDETVVTLTLPESLNGSLDADLDVSAGSVRATGDFDELDVQLSAGVLRVEGSARSVDADISAGSASLELADVRDADLSMSAGSLSAQFTGSQPDELEAEVNAGLMRLTIPGGQYALEQNVSAGSFDHDLDTSSSSPHQVSVKVSAGSLRIDTRG